ncbi:MAG: GGDEF domain-containing protein [Candidatus Nanopelagicaceae bacterium]|nr:GGDEF domain-containing protein [Candidatus Nanopelagicaceae bacterium]
MMRSHDGLRDSLTHLASPGLFYEELRREIARARRSGDQISLARFVLRVNLPENVGLPPSEFDIEVLSFGHTLSRLTRAEDICSRMGNLEFLVLLRGDDVVATQLSERVALTWIGDLTKHAGSDYQCRVTLENSHLQRITDETALEFLNRLDQKVRTDNPSL